MTEFLSFPGLGLDFTINRVAFTIAGQPIYWYGIIISIGFVLALLYAFRRAKEFGVNVDRMIDVVLVATIGGMIGARLYYVAFSWDTYKDNPIDIFNIRLGGIAIYGGIIGAVLVGALMCKLRHIRLLPMLDLVVGGFFIGQGIGRWGNFVNIEAFGGNTNLPWGMSSPAIENYLRVNLKTLQETGMVIDPTMPVHPTFFYEFLVCLLGFAFIAWFTSRRRFDGELTLFYAAWYGAGRFVIEGLRTDSLMFGSIRASQLLALCTSLAAVIIWIVIRSKIHRNNDENYLIPFGRTDESAKVVSGEYYKELKAEREAAKEAAKALKSGDKESVPVEVAEELENAQEQPKESPVEAEPVQGPEIEETADQEDAIQETGEASDDEKKEGE